MTEENIDADAPAEPTLEDIAGEAPVIVRVELGSVTLAAREWAQLGPGDVLATGQSLGQLATLRAAGHPVARGELVNLDGELGVRITELLRHPG